MLEQPVIYNGLTMNDQTKRSLMVSPFYFIPVRSVDGLWGADVRYESHVVPSADGERSGDVFYSGKTITLSGQVIARDLATLRQGQRALQQAFWDLEKHDLQFTLWGEVQAFVTCRVSQPFVMAEQQQDELPTRTWTVALRADDPRIFKVADGTPLYSWMT